MHTEAITDHSAHREAPTEAAVEAPVEAPAEAPADAPAEPSPGGRPSPEEAPVAASQTREAINLRLLLELRRRLKSAAEKELAVGAERMRALRSLLRRAESELRLCARALETRAQQLAQTAGRVEKAQSEAAHTCARLSSLEHEHADLSQQLSAAQNDAAGLQLSVSSAVGQGSLSSEVGALRPGSARARSGTLDSFVLATAALLSDLSHAIADQSSLRTRGRDLIERGESCAARARSLQTCFQNAHRAMTAIGDEIRAALDGSRG
jgi:chromosome segregation ATPase